MDRYQRVEKPRKETPSKENEIRITAMGRMRGYVTYATNLFLDKGSNKIVFKAMGRAINKTVLIVELIKRRVAGLHQDTSIGSTYITDSWVPLEEGLLPLEITRHVSVMAITLSKQELDRSSVGYQSTLSEDQVKPYAKYESERESYPASRGRGRGNLSRGKSRGNGPAMLDSGDGGEGNRRRGYGRGGSGRGRGRGGNGGSGGPLDNQQEAGGHSEEAPAPLKGQGPQRGRGRNGGRGPDAISNGPISAGAGAGAGEA
ncbi:hypothetical protein IEQ34_019179 [Dendrobium chrysotoxum]|uniref:DNA/RNA-binding protein Alba-like domain-containing protein n=1 Tax=Dendrobium chrysotoxum TaxID=161865 RepID=A0AAV7G7X3_DENCH|nr:hypothetical protein IEQ34_019179 [Dendrobium chrysotoxum]